MTTNRRFASRRVVSRFSSSVDDHTLAQHSAAQCSAAGRNRNANSDSRVKWKRSSLVVRHEDGTERRGTTGEYRDIVARESRPPIAHHHHHRHHLHLHLHLRSTRIRAHFSQK